jgi:transcriptional regulator with XRE-family HTH domain
MEAEEIIQNCLKNQPKNARFDAVGIDDLEQTLREQIKKYLTTEFVETDRQVRGTYDRLAEGSGVSKSYINRFYHGKSICIKNMNRLAEFFGVSFVVTNFPVD